MEIKIQIQWCSCVQMIQLYIVTDSWEDLQYEMKKWNDELNRYKMKMNIKTEVMKVSRHQDGGVQMEGQQLIQAEHFRYLGVEFSKDNQQEYEINNRITKYCTNCTIMT